MIEVAITSHSGLGAPAALTIKGHPAVRAITVSRDLGDSGRRTPTLRGVPCFLLDFADEVAADEALARISAVSKKFTHKETPTRVACSGEVHYTLRVVRGFDEEAIAAIAEHYDDAEARYAAAQQDYLRQGARHTRP